MRTLQQLVGATESWQPFNTPTTTTTTTTTKLKLSFFLSSPLSLLSSSSPFLSPITPNPSPQVVEKARMELVEVEASLDMAWAAVDDFLVEELLVEPEQEEEEEEEVEAFGTEEANVSPSSSSALSSHPPPPIDFPAEDVAELEWVSRFVDDSFLEFSSEEDHNPHRHARPPHQTPLPFLSSKRPPPSIDHLLVPVKARTKRSRTAGHFWLTSPSPSSSSSSTSAHFPEVRKHKKRGRKPKPRPLPAPPPAATGERSCTHCGVQKTPQWRAGPAGPKTLCNACGVRYKSGRLLPEYRPASSPTFSVQLHSNSHRKVIEMRSKKARAEPDRTGFELLP